MYRNLEIMPHHLTHRILLTQNDDKPSTSTLLAFTAICNNLTWQRIRCRITCRDLNMIAIAAYGYIHICWRCVFFFTLLAPERRKMTRITWKSDAQSYVRGWSRCGDFLEYSICVPHANRTSFIIVKCQPNIINTVVFINIWQQRTWFSIGESANFRVPHVPTAHYAAITSSDSPRMHYALCVCVCACDYVYVRWIYS